MVEDMATVMDMVTVMENMAVDIILMKKNHF